MVQISQTQMLATFLRLWEGAEAFDISLTFRLADAKHRKIQNMMDYI